MNIARSILEKARSFGSKTAIKFNQTAISFSALNQRIQIRAKILIDLKIGPGDRVALLLPKGLEFIETYFAVLGIGAVALPLNPAYQRDEICYFLSDSESRLLVTTSEKSLGLAPEINRFPNLQVFLTDKESPSVSNRHRIGDPSSVGDYFYPAEKDGIALLCYTSGTTGRSKGAMITHGNLIHNLMALENAWQWTEADRLLHVLPLFHIHGLTVALHGALHAGSSIIMEENFDPCRAWDLLEREQCTMFMAVPTIYHRMSLAWESLENKPDLTSIRVFISGSAPLPEPLFHRFKNQTGQTILERYGMTETGMITSNPYAAELRKVKSVGYPLDGVNVRIMAKDGQPAKEGEVGEVWIKGENVFKGYWMQPEKTADSFEGDWFKSGDLGFLDPKDHLRLYLVGRGKELIITGGYNVYPKEIENVLEEHEAVQESAVFGLPHDDFGEAVVGAVVLKAGSDLSEDDLISFCKTRLVGYKCPKTIFFRTSLPRNSMGKLQKQVLQKDYA